MNFIFADNLDTVDPNYDFSEDRSPSDREPYWDDYFPHEILKKSPYDGMLVSRATIGSRQISGLYNESQAMQFLRVGARKFLRFSKKDYPNSIVMGDCGAFSYHNMDEPPYTIDEIVEFYGDGQFEAGCSLDHIIFNFANDSDVKKFDRDTFAEMRRRFEITLENASKFYKQSKHLDNFSPIGVVQGWSPKSMADAAEQLKKMGYKYIAIGGMALQSADQVKTVLKSIVSKTGNNMKIHILGFAKADQISEFSNLNLYSFDTTSPLVRAFKDSHRNYYLLQDDNTIDYYSSIRIPQSIENKTLVRLAKAGKYSQEELQRLERDAMDAIIRYDEGKLKLMETLETIMNYSAPLLVEYESEYSDRNQKKLKVLRERYQRCLKSKPWKRCRCKICTEIGVQVIIFRGSNRNKRRGFHNLYTYGKLVNNINGS